MRMDNIKDSTIRSYRSALAYMYTFCTSTMKILLIDTRSSITILGLKRWDPWESMASILTCGQICTASPIYIYFVPV